MDTTTCSYRTATGWSAPLPSALDGPQTLVLAFAGAEFADHPRPFDDLRAAFPQAAVLGCSTSGEIAGHRVGDAGISVAITRFAHTRLRHASTPVHDSAESAAAGARLAAALQADDLCAVLVLSDGLGVNGTALVAGLTQALPAGLPVTGGLAGDGDRFARTWVLHEGQPQGGRVTAVGFYGKRLRVGHGCSGGWRDFGPVRRITRSRGNVLFELDGKPALELYKRYLGELAAGLPGTALRFPLSIRPAGSGGPALVRTILAIDEAQRSMTFAGDMPEGFEACLMRTSTDQLIGSATQAVARAAQGLAADSRPLMVSVSCVGRRLVLGERTEEEVEAVADGAPPGAAHVGFYSYGEIAPALPGSASELHNQTMTVTVFSEA